MNYSDFKPDVIVLGPGGTKGFLQLGALVTLERENLLQDVKEFCGVSIGSIVSLLIVCGYTPGQAILMAKSLRLVPEINLDQALEKKGLFSTDHINKFLRNKVMDKFPTPHIPSLYQLYQMTGKTLTVVAYNKTQRKTVYFSHSNFPNISCITPILLSINIPLIHWEATFDGDVYVDGAFGNPYPVNYFDDGKTKILGIFMIDNENITKNEIQFFIDNAITNIRNYIIPTCSENVLHLELKTDIQNTVIDIDILDGYRMVLEGMKITKKFISELKEGKYNLPKSIELPPKRNLSSISNLEND